jgi:hypothetical protein
MKKPTEDDLRKEAALWDAWFAKHKGKSPEEIMKFLENEGWIDAPDSTIMSRHLEEHEYKMFLAEVERLMNLHPEPDSHEGKRLALFATVVENYEKIHFPMPKPTGEELRRFREEQERGGVG